jgi:hypothetical protein
MINDRTRRRFNHYPGSDTSKGGGQIPFKNYCSGAIIQKNPDALGDASPGKDEAEGVLKNSLLSNLIRDETGEW